MKKKYILHVHVNGSHEETQELDWTEEDFKDYEDGDEDLAADAGGLAMDMVGFEFWITEGEE